MNFWEWFGLILAGVVLLTTLIGSIYDALRKFAWGQPSLSMLIWGRFTLWKTGRGPFPWGSVAIVAWWILGAIGLAMHFYL